MHQLLRRTLVQHSPDCRKAGLLTKVKIEATAYLIHW